MTFKVRESEQQNLYHGSATKFSTLQPMASQLLGGKKVIFASPHRAVALCFAGVRWSDDDLALGAVNGRLYAEELKKGAFSVFDFSGWLYVFKDTNATSDTRLGSFEVVLTKPVVPDEVIFIPNILAELRKDPEIKLIGY